MTLQSRVIAAVASIAVVLVAVLVFVARTTESNLVRQVDAQLEDAVQPVRAVDFGRPNVPGRRGPELSALYVGRVVGDQVTTLVTPGVRREQVPLPVIDASEAVASAETREPFTVASAESGLRWRVRAYPGALNRSVVVIGLPLDTVDATISDLVTLELIGGGVILVALALVALWVIRLGVRPIKTMTEVAGAIADGDLTQRVPDTDPSTEAGALGDALNRMLGSIEATFAERQRIEERLRQFVADASHELRTPIATIRGYAELHRTGGLDTDAALADAMRRTEEEAVRMGGLVADLLSLARLDEGQPLVSERVDLAAVVQDVASDARAVDPDRPIVARTAGPAVVRGDDAKLRQVVANVVDNALVHTPPGTPVTITTGSRDDGWRFVEVHDDGPGLPPAVAERAFERFFRADPSRARDHGGSGLGLAIVDAIVRAHGGRVRLDSTPGAGTTVCIELTAAPVGATAEPMGIT